MGTVAVFWKNEVFENSLLVVVHVGRIHWSISLGRDVPSLHIGTGWRSYAIIAERVCHGAKGALNNGVSRYIQEKSKTAQIGSAGCALIPGTGLSNEKRKKDLATAILYECRESPKDAAEKRDSPTQRRAGRDSI